MRKRQTGSITETKSGWRAQIWAGGRRVSMGVHPTRAEAEAILEGAVVDLHDSAHRDGATLKTWGARALDRREGHGLRGIKEERSRWAVHIAADPIAHLLVRTIVRADVQQWLDRRSKATTQGARARKGRRVSRTTIGNALTLLRAVLEDAVAHGVAAENAAANVHLPRGRGVTVEPWTYLEPAEQIRLLDAASPLARPAVAFAIATGLRQGEQWALELVDVHIDVPAPYVVVRFGAPGLPTKSGKPRRVDLLPHAVEAVRDQLAILDAVSARARRRRKGATNPHGLLFPSLRGTRRPRGAPTGWEAWVAAAELGRSVRWHDLRHTCASSLVAGWWGRAWTLLEVRALLGHSTVTITERYAHLAGTVTEDAARATRESTRSAHGGGEEGRKYLSHFRDLNSRPTVYEPHQECSSSAGGPLLRARGCALEAVEAIAAGGELAASKVVTALEGAIRAIDEALAAAPVQHRPALRSLKGGRS